MQPCVSRHHAAALPLTLTPCPSPLGPPPNSVPPAIVEEYRMMSADSAKQRWRALVEEALLLQSEGVAGDGGALEAAQIMCGIKMWR